MPDEYSTIQSAIDAASEGDSVLVSAGTYYENIVWADTNGIKLIGSGEDDCFIDGGQEASVIRFEEDLGGIIDATTFITGFTIQNGYAQDYGYSGGQNLASGGGMYLFSSSPSLSDVTFSGNSANMGGGGMHLLSSSPTFTNVIISDNSAIHGGGMYISSSSPTFTNVTISDNSATYGGGMHLLSSSPTFTNVTFSGNSATYGGGIFFLFNIHSGLDGSSPTLTNSILWGNLPQEIYFFDDGDPSSITIAYSDIQGGEEGIGSVGSGIVYWGEGNIDADPQFTDPDNGDFTLQATSPCIDAGDPSSPLDPDGTRADMGAYYFQH